MYLRDHSNIFRNRAELIVNLESVRILDRCKFGYIAKSALHFYLGLFDVFKPLECVRKVRPPVATVNVKRVTGPHLPIENASSTRTSARCVFVKFTHGGLTGGYK